MSYVWYRIEYTALQIGFGKLIFRSGCVLNFLNKIVPDFLQLEARWKQMLAANSNEQPSTQPASEVNEGHKTTFLLSSRVYRTRNISPSRHNHKLNHNFSTHLSVSFGQHFSLTVNHQRVVKSYLRYLNEYNFSFHFH